MNKIIIEKLRKNTWDRYYPQQEWKLTLSNDALHYSWKWSGENLIGLIEAVKEKTETTITALEQLLFLWEGEKSETLNKLNVELEKWRDMKGTMNNYYDRKHGNLYDD